MPLSDLIAALAAATGASREMDERIAVEVFGWKPHPTNPVRWKAPGAQFYGIGGPPDCTSSVDAIAGECARRWPEQHWSVYSTGVAIVGPAAVHLGSGGGNGPALALCLAAARLALAQGED